MKSQEFLKCRRGRQKNECQSDDIAGFEHGGRGHELECEQPLEARKGKKKISLRASRKERSPTT